MYVVKPISEAHLETVFAFASASNSGIINLPKNRHILHQRIHDSIKSFGKHIEAPENEVYFFVLEDLHTHEIIGVCGIYSKITGMYYYHVESQSRDFDNPHIPQHVRVLSTVQRIKESSEICALYLSPNHRKGGLGKLLSLSRFLFIASFRDRFEDNVIAEMRGIISTEQQPPFWQSLGRHFYNIEYIELIKELEVSKGIIPHIIPKHPIYSILLSKEAQECIGHVHPHTKPALEMLLHEGFKMTHDVDLFDAGPKIQANTSDIRLIKESQVACVAEIASNSNHSDEYIICNAHLNFRACLGHVQQLTPNEVLISHHAAEALEVKKGDSVRFGAFSIKNKNNR